MNFFQALFFTTVQVVFITAKITFIFTALLMFINSLINTGRRMFNLCPLLFTAAFDTAYHDEGERGQKGNVKTRDKISISPSSENIWARVTEWSTSFFFSFVFCYCEASNQLQCHNQWAALRDWSKCHIFTSGCIIKNLTPKTAMKS